MTQEHKDDRCQCGHARSSHGAGGCRVHFSPTHDDCECLKFRLAIRHAPAAAVSAPAVVATERTSRGFRIYGRVPTVNGGSLRVQESSSIADEPRLWLFLDGEKCVEHLGEHMKPDPHLSLSQAAELRDALDTFIRESES